MATYQITATESAKRLTRLGLNASAVTVNGSDFVVTTGTGEVSFGRDGGECAFAYDAADVASFLEERAGATRLDYSDDFCSCLDPVEDRGLAVVLAATKEMRLTAAGACTPILSTAEYVLVRAAVEAAAG